MRHVFIAITICFGMFLLSGCSPSSAVIPSKPIAPKYVEIPNNDHPVSATRFEQPQPSNSNETSKPVEIPIPTYSKPDVIPSSGPLPQIEEGKK